MSDHSPHSNDPTELVRVEPDTIERFEHEQHAIGDMYQRLFETNPDLALYLRRRVAEVAPKLDEREGQSQVALELISLIIRQQGIIGLDAWWDVEPLPDIVPPAA